MAVFSSLGAVLRRGLTNLSQKMTKSPNLSDGVRQMSSQRVMVVRPSRFQWRKMKDLLHLYTIVGAVPFGLVVLYANLFIGPSRLAETPEGYEPERYEYYSHPIKRWFAKHIYPPDQQHYEKYLHHLCSLEERRQMRLLEKKIRNLMKERGDYKGWYYLPFTAKYYRFVRDEHERATHDWDGIND